MGEVQQIGRRTWLARLGGGAMALWAGLEFGRGREGWGVLLGGGAPHAHAQAQPPLQTIPVRADFEFPAGQPYWVNAFVLIRGREVAIVDTLIAGNADRIGQAIQQAGLDWGAVRHVILTHFHPDHQGGADAISQLATRATLWAGEPDIPELRVSRTVQPAYDGDEVFGLRIVSSPGHTPGHIAVLDPAGAALMTGDALFNDASFNRVGGGLAMATPPSFDRATSLESLRKLGAINIDRVLFAHGAPIESGGAAAIAAFAAQAQAEPPHLASHHVECCPFH